MSTELKSQISRDELLKLLEVYNTIEAAVDDATESLDVNLSTLKDMVTLDFGCTAYCLMMIKHMIGSVEHDPKDTRNL